MPYPLPLTRTEAYLAYKAGVIQQSDLKPSLAVPRNGIDAWLAYWTGLAADYPKREDGTPHILQEEEAYIAYLCGVINEYPEKCLRRVGAYLRYLISARWGRPDHPLNREELYLSLLKTQVIPSGDPSSDIVINGTAKAPFQDVKMYGDTFQQTYTGKNLLNPFAQHSAGWTTSSAGIDYTLQSDGSVYCEGQATAASHVNLFGEWSNNSPVYIQLDTSKTYTAKLFGAPDGWIGILKDGAREYKRINNPTTITGAEGITLARLDFANGRSSDLLANIQVEAGSTATSFEPYVGGTASPNPSYPQQVQTVTGEQTVEIVGKNLFNKSTATIGYRLGSDGLPYQDNLFALSDYMPITPSTSYAYSRGGTGNGASAIVFYDSNKAFISRIMPTIGISSVSGTVTSPNNAYYARIAELKTLVDSVQFELGSTASSYAPYSKQTLPIDLGSIELCKLGTYQDYIYKDGENWKVHKATGKKVLNGSESYARFVSNNIVRFIAFIDGSINTTTRSDLFRATHFHYLGTGDEVGGAFLNASNIGLMFGANDESIGQFKEWLSSNNVTLDFALATPTDTVITDSNLITQLNALVNGGAENGTTYIKVSATDPNLPGLLVVEAPKYE